MSVLLVVLRNVYGKSTGHYEQQPFILLQSLNNTHNSPECHLGINWSLWTKGNINRIFQYVHASLELSGDQEKPISVCLNPVLYVPSGSERPLLTPSLTTPHHITIHGPRRGRSTSALLQCRNVNLSKLISQPPQRRRSNRDLKNPVESKK